MRRVELIDTTLRDGNQSLWSATGITNQIVRDVAGDLEQAGFRALDFITSTHMGTAVRWHREDPWERIRLAAEAMPNTPLGFLTTGLRFIGWEKLHEDVIAFAMKLLVKHGIRRMWVIDPMNDADAVLRSVRLAKEAGASEVIAGIVYSLSPVHTPERYREMARLLGGASSVDGVYLKDPSGLLTPETTEATLRVIQAEIADLPLELHSHSNTGLAPACYVTAAAVGVDRLHTACRPLANGTSQPATEMTAHNLRELGFALDVDDDAVRRASAFLAQVAEREGLPLGSPAEYDVACYKHQLPGGMISTLARQLREVRMEERLAQALTEIPRVREELGFPIMVTPLSQFVASQAVMNVASDERYKMVSDQVIRYVRGEFGTPPAPIDPDLKESILSRPRAKKLARIGAPRSLEEWRSLLGPGIADEELLLRIVMPAEQVDAVFGPRASARERQQEGARR
jgi:oxaloacetate decarboxylase (Na+ extruding) subunit alpha